MVEVNGLKRMKKAELQAMAKEMKIDTEGSVKELTERIIEFVEKHNDKAENEDCIEVMLLVTRMYRDKEFERIVEKGEVIEVDKTRADILINANVARLVD